MALRRKIRRLGSVKGGLRSDVETLSATFRIEGLSTLKTNLDRLSKSVQRDAMRRAGFHALDLIADAARQLVPVGESGGLKQSIRVDVAVTRKAASLAKARSAFVISGAASSGGESQTHTRIYMGAGDGQLGSVYYAHFVEYGTVKMAAKPFMRPAVDTTARQAMDEIGLFLKWEIDKAVAGRASANDNFSIRRAA